MTIALVLGSYLLVALVSGGAAARHALRLETRRGEWLDGVDRGVMALAAVVAGLAWLPLGLVLVHGWARQRLPGHLAAGRERVRRARPAGAGDRAARPAPAARPTLHLYVPPSLPTRPLRGVTAHSLWPAEQTSAA